MIIKYYRYVIAFFVLLSAFNFSVYSQRLLHDSTYYKTFPNALTIRVYSIKDYADFTFPAISGNSDLKYRANTTVNLGAGATYDNISLNLSTNVGFINKEMITGAKLKPSIYSYISYQENGFLIFFTCIIRDFMLTHAVMLEVPNSYYYRPDVKMDLVGFTAYRNFNYERFTMRSAFNQNEWVKKSAGSFLLGGNIYYQKIYSKDSSLVPPKVAGFFSSTTFKDFHFVTFGPGAGYAYNVVFAKHFFILGSAIVNGNINLATDGNGAINNKKTSFEPAFIYKAAVGYNGSVWNVNIDWAGEELLIKQANVSKTNSFPTGFVRFMVAKQIMLKKQIPVIGNIIHSIFGNDD